MTYRATGRPSPGRRLAIAVLHRLRRIRRPKSAEDWLGAGLIAVVAVLMIAQALAMLVEWLLRTWWALPSLAVGMAVSIWARWRVRILRARATARRLAELRYSLEQLDAMTPSQFEDAVRDLMRRDGMDARRVGGAGDLAADVIGTHPPTRQIVVVQCKHTTTGRSVESRVIHEVNGTAGPAHRADVAVVVTNGGFTREARRRAAQFRMALIDRERLEQWADQGASLPDMLTLGSRWRGRRYRLLHRLE
ncbi:restriction endonuclease [Actinomadura sp. NBRC 104425]|uniref:restriction endonuclease n=1 Tax=Actinomadura sp. NBRC 104425 TaxID=3032204 RepID=UPI0024A5CFB0|nr:restriction endonuclease [Actinomadura sp. NBRC 104425]GLZ16377.1 restriction endonuclease [Actinomadura sp. NBRC 104425]